MKRLKLILKWALISLILQLCILYYINNYFLTGLTTIRTEKVFAENKMSRKIEITVPSDAKEIKSSYDGKYISYLEGNGLFITDTATSKVVKKIKIDGKNIDYYTWLTDRNRILYLNKTGYGKEKQINLEAYDADNKLNNTVNKTIYAPDKSVVSDLTLSPLTNMIYINVNSIDQSKLYQINIMGEIKRIYLPVKKIVKMYETQRNDNLIYESPNNIIHIIKDGKKDHYLSTKKYSLIGIDKSDNVYIGSLNNYNMIDKIYYGSVEKPLKKWNEINLKEMINPKDIVMLPKNDRLNKIVNNSDLEDVVNGTIIKGYGQIIDINKNYIVYRNQDKIILKLY